MRFDDGIAERSPTQFLVDDLRERLRRRTEVEARNGRLTGLFCHDLPRYGVMSEAGMADLMGVTLSKLRGALPYGVAVKTVAGFRVTRKGQKWVRNLVGKAHSRAVICMTNGARFASIQDAADANGTTRATLSLAIRQHRGTGGLRFKYADAGKTIIRASRPWRKPILCVETGQVFIGLLAAAKSVGAGVNTIHKGCRTGRLCKGFHWRYAEAAKEAA